MNYHQAHPNKAKSKKLKYHGHGHSRRVAYKRLRNSLGKLAFAIDVLTVAFERSISFPIGGTAKPKDGEFIVPKMNDANEQ